MLTPALYRYERAHNQARRAYVTVEESDLGTDPDEHPAYTKFLRWATIADTIYSRLTPEDRMLARSLCN